MYCDIQEVLDLHHMKTIFCEVNTTRFLPSMFDVEVLLSSIGYQLQRCVNLLERLLFAKLGILGMKRAYNLEVRIRFFVWAL